MSPDRLICSEGETAGDPMTVCRALARGIPLETPRKALGSMSKTASDPSLFSTIVVARVAGLNMVVTEVVGMAVALPAVAED